MEKRLLLAFVLSAAILLAWSILFPPPQPTRATPGQEAIQPDGTTTVAPSPEAGPDQTNPPEEIVEEVAAAELLSEAVGSTTQKIVVLRNDKIEVELTNQGAAVSAYRLSHYDGDDGRPLDLVQTVPLPERSLPLQLVSSDGPDNELYAVEEIVDGAVFRWADGLGNAVEKRIILTAEGSAEGYGLDVEISAVGRLSEAAVSIGSGMRDLGEREQDSRLALWGEGIVLADGEVERFKRKKVKEPRVLTPSSVTYAGFEDAYFLNVLRPQVGISEIRIQPLQYAVGEDEDNQVLEIVVAPNRGELRGQLLGAPKEYDLLRGIGHGIEETLNFGIFTPISVFFLKALRWIYGHVGNYGIAIILLTFGIRILLFPLMHTSTVSMRKMAKVQPKVKEIQAKYKKKKTDQQARAKMNQEMMALYKVEGVNPMAGCLPLLVQLPLLWALYQLFLKAIELRHAPFMLWITDLSAKDPLYVTPILMTATMWLQQRLAPQAGDPQQQRLMRMMPLIFGIMFLQFPSGLVLYWLANNVITIIQQEITLNIIGERKLGSRWRSRKDTKK